MPNIIVSRHEDIHRNKTGKQLVWQNGVILYNKKINALSRVQVDYHHRVVKLWVQGKGAKEYLAILNDEINQILERMEKLESEELLILPDTARILSTDSPIIINSNNNSDKTTYQRLIKEAKEGNEIFTSDDGQSYDLIAIIEHFMSQKQQSSNNIVINYYDYGIRTIGNHNIISSNIIFTPEQQENILELQESISKMMTLIEDHDATFTKKINAYNELNEINNQLSKLENTPENQNKLKQMLASIRNGTSEAIKLAKKIKDHEKTLTWLMSKVETVSNLLQNL